MKIITAFVRLALAGGACVVAMTTGIAWAENDQPLRENWAPSEWGADDKAYKFLFAWSPLKIKGGTGSPGNPIAIY